MGYTTIYLVHPCNIPMELHGTLWNSMNLHRTFHGRSPRSSMEFPWMPMGLPDRAQGTRRSFMKFLGHPWSSMDISQCGFHGIRGVPYNSTQIFFWDFPRQISWKRSWNLCSMECYGKTGGNFEISTEITVEYSMANSTVDAVEEVEVLSRWF